MLSVEQIEIINSLTEDEVEKKIDFIASSYEGANKECIIEALNRRLKELRSKSIALIQFNEAQSDFIGLKD